MTELEKQQQKEIERLQKKIKALSEAYNCAVTELKQLKKEEKEIRKKGRPSVDQETKARILSLCRQGHTMRSISQQVKLSTGAVHKIIAEASKASRVLYIYMDRKTPATLLDVCGLTQKVKITNLTDDMLSRAFGIREKPDWKEYLEFMESRCMPRTRYGIGEELSHMGIDTYDPFQIVEKTQGRVYGDGQWMKKMNGEWMAQYDLILKQVKSGADQERKLLQLIGETVREDREGL